MIQFYFVICVDQEGDADWCFTATIESATQAALRMNETAFDDAVIYKVTLPGLDTEAVEYDRTQEYVE